MQTLFADLTSVVRQEIESYRKLLAIMRRERGRIVRGELGGLVEVVRQKEALTKELSELEVSRASLLDRLATEFGQESSSVTLGRIAAMGPGADGATLRALLVEFRGVVGQLVAANDVNRTLLDRSLECVHGSLEMFRPVAAGAPTYGAGGRFNGSSHALAVVNQTA